MSDRNYDALVSILATDVTSRLERAIKKCTFNRLGGLILDQEIRALGSYLTGATSWSIRDKMVRLTQIATLLNLEQVTYYCINIYINIKSIIISCFKGIRIIGLLESITTR